MVPLQGQHAANSVLESDRVLMVSGSLADSTFGAASSALFDGQSLTPYITSASSAGTAGSVSALFHSFSSFSFSQRRRFQTGNNVLCTTHCSVLSGFLAAGIVILISIAIAAGIVFFLALIGILWTLFSKKEDKLSQLEPEEDDDSTRHRPSSLLENINAATRSTILGSKAPYGAVTEKDEDGAQGAPLYSSKDPFGDTSNFERPETPSDIDGGVLSANGETSRPAHARYSFDGTGEGELALTSGQEVQVLDDRDAACVGMFSSLISLLSGLFYRWWYARDTRTGREGVVPAAYLY